MKFLNSIINKILENKLFNMIHINMNIQKHLQETFKVMQIKLHLKEKVIQLEKMVLQ